MFLKKTRVIISILGLMTLLFIVSEPAAAGVNVGLSANSASRGTFDGTYELIRFSHIGNSTGQIQGLGTVWGTLGSADSGSENIVRGNTPLTLVQIRVASGCQSARLQFRPSTINLGSAGSVNASAVTVEISRHPGGSKAQIDAFTQLLCRIRKNQDMRNNAELLPDLNKMINFFDDEATNVIQ